MIIPNEEGAKMAFQWKDGAGIIILGCPTGCNSGSSIAAFGHIGAK
jgi:hypothetical protein